MQDDRDFTIIARLDDRPWTADLALNLLPVNTGPRVEVYRGSIVTTPRARPIDCATAEFELVTRLRECGLIAYLRINVVSDLDLFVPDIVVLRERGGNRAAVGSKDVLLVGEVIADDRPQVIDRPRAYAAAGFDHYLVLDCRDRRRPRLTLHERDGVVYRPMVSAETGAEFVMTAPFRFMIDPAKLLDE